MPLRMIQAILDCGPRIGGKLGPIHRLQHEPSEFEIFETLVLRTHLGIDKFQIMPGFQNQLCAGFWADTDPVDTNRGQASSVRFYCDLEACSMESFDRFRI